MGISVRKLFSLFLLIAFFWVIPAKAGTCTTCYIDYENGNDSWDGTSKTFTGGTTGPWKHAPGMQGLTVSGSSTGDGCTGNCAAQVPGPGDKYLLKGGVVWPYTTLPWLFSGNGNASTQSYGCAGDGCVYVGVDPTWNKGTVNAVTLNRDLGGCTSAPTVSFSGGGGSGASATATIITNTVEPNVSGFVLSISITNPGSGYTTPPSVTVSGGGCTQVSAVADIRRAVIDAGAKSNIDWPVGYGDGNLKLGPGLTPSQSSYLIIDSLEIRNILQTARSVNGISSGIVTAFLGNEQGGSGHITYSNNYLHGRFTDCNSKACANQEQADRGIILGHEGDEAAYNYITNGDGFFVGTGSTYCGVNAPCEFGENSIAGAIGTSAHHNHVYGVRWLMHFGGNGPTPTLIHDNELWLVLYDAGGAHVNELYFLFTTGTLYEYNNIFHSAVSGASNQQQMGNGTTQYFFNNVSWGLGGGTSNWGIDANFGAGPGGGHFYFFNNTMDGNGNGVRNCIDGSGTSSSVLFVVLQNNHCITGASPYWIQPAGSNYSNHSGSTSAPSIQAASAVQTVSKANSQGYLLRTTFSPNVGMDTVTFANGSTAANLSSLCTGLLTPLCQDIYGNPRPTSGGWQAGAFYLSPGKTSVVAPPTALMVIPQ